VTGVVRRLVWRLFPPTEVKAVRAHMRELLRRLSPTYPLPAAFERRVLAMNGDPSRVVRLVRDEHQAADYVALVLLYSTAEALLRSGRYHLYRGVLSGEGHALNSVVTRCMAELEQRGYQTKEKTQELTQRLRDEIKKLG